MKCITTIILNVRFIIILNFTRPRQACNYAMGSYTLITLVYWSYCRYSWSKEKFIAAQIQEGMRRHAIYQGTDLERQVRSEFDKEIKAEDA